MIYYYMTIHISCCPSKTFLINEITLYIFYYQNLFQRIDIVLHDYIMIIKQSNIKNKIHYEEILFFIFMLIGNVLSDY